MQRAPTCHPCRYASHQTHGKEFLWTQVLERKWIVVDMSTACAGKKTMVKSFSGRMFCYNLCLLKRRVMVKSFSGQKLSRETLYHDMFGVFGKLAKSSFYYLEKVLLGANFLSCNHLKSYAIHGKEFLWTQFVPMLPA